MTTTEPVTRARMAWACAVTGAVRLPPAGGSAGSAGAAGTGCAAGADAAFAALATAFWGDFLASTVTAGSCCARAGLQRAGIAAMDRAAAATICRCNADLDGRARGGKTTNMGECPQRILGVQPEL